jgi:hypothetical protein
MPHYQHRNGGRGYIFYRVRGWVAVGAGLGAWMFGEDSEAAEFVDFMNPVSDVQDILFPEAGRVFLKNNAARCEPEGAL